MKGETNLAKLLEDLQPQLLDGEFVFCSTNEAIDFERLKPLATFREAEGLSLVLHLEAASKVGLTTEPRFRCILLSVHSSLEAVGLTATVSGALTEQGISANVIAPYYHDYVFVQSDDAAAALDVLIRLTKN